MPTGTYHRRFLTVYQRFDSFVDKAGSRQPHMETKCWLWTGADSRGYGRFRPVGAEEPVYAHRFAAERRYGPSELDVLHACDNTMCVRPSHLSYGTHVENMADKIKRGRNQDAKGEANPAAVMTERKVRMIRRSTKTQTELAREYGITQAAVSLIIRRRTWQHVE